MSRPSSRRGVLCAIAALATTGIIGTMPQPVMSGTARSAEMAWLEACLRPRTTAELVSLWRLAQRRVEGMPLRHALYLFHRGQGLTPRRAMAAADRAIAGEALA